MRVFRWIVLAVCLPVALAAAYEGDRLAESASPDGRFVLRVTGKPERPVLVESAADRVVADRSGRVMGGGEAAGFALVWAGDARMFAVNFHAAERRETTALFRWDGEKFVELEFPEAALHEEIIEPGRKRELAIAGMPADSALHRVWDKWRTVKWQKDGSAAVRGESVSAYLDGNGEPAEIALAAEATVRFDDAGRPVIVASREAVAGD